jgi:hypothetical protein
MEMETVGGKVETIQGIAESIPIARSPHIECRRIYYRRMGEVVQMESFRRRQVVQSILAVSGGIGLAGCSSDTSGCENVKTASFRTEDGDEFWISAYVPIAIDPKTGEPISNPDDCSEVPSYNNSDPSDSVTQESVIVPADEYTIDGAEADYLDKDLKYNELEIPIQIVWGSTLETHEGIEVITRIEPRNDVMKNVFHSQVRENSPVQGFEALAPLPAEHRFDLAEEASKADDTSKNIGSPKITYPMRNTAEEISLIRGDFNRGFTIPVKFSLEIDFSDNCEVSLDRYPTKGPYTSTMLVANTNSAFTIPDALLDSAGAAVTTLEEYANDWASTGADATQLTALAANRNDLSDEQLEAGLRVSQKGISAFDDLLEEKASEYDECFSHPGGPTLTLNTTIGESATDGMETSTRTPSPPSSQTPRPFQPFTQFQLDDANTGFGPDLRSPPADSERSVNRISDSACKVPPVLADGRMYACFGNRVAMFDREHELIDSHDLGEDVDVVTTPTVVDGVVYLGTDEPAMYAIKFDGSDGWRVSPFRGEPVSPTFHEGYLYTATDSGRLYCLGTDGRIAEYTDFSFDGPSTPRQSLPSDGEQLYVSGTKEIQAFKFESLEPAWEKPLDTWSYTNDLPAVSTDERSLVYSPEGDGVVARRQADGQVVWQSEADTTSSVPTVTDQWVYVTSGSQSEVRAYRRGEGPKDARIPTNRKDLGADIVGEVLVAGDYVYCSTDYGVHCLNKSLDSVWEASYDEGINDVETAPVVANDAVYVGTENGLILIE